MFSNIMCPDQLFLSYRAKHRHTHTHTQPEREREIERERLGRVVYSCVLQKRNYNDIQIKQMCYFPILWEIKATLTFDLSGKQFC